MDYMTNIDIEIDTNSTYFVPKEEESKLKKRNAFPAWSPNFQMCTAHSINNLHKTASFPVNAPLDNFLQTSHN